MGWFGRKSEIPAPDNKSTRPLAWTVTSTAPGPSKTRPPTISHLFDEIAHLADDEEAIRHLRTNDHPSIRTILRYMLDERIEFYVSATDYDINNWAEAPTLYQEANRLYLFCNDPLRPSTVFDNPGKRQRLFSNFLSALAPAEIKVVVGLLDKMLPPGLSEELILQAYPDLLPTDLSRLQQQNARKLAERELARLHNEKTRLEALTESEVQATQILKNKQAAMEQMNTLLAAAHRRLNEMS